ncbi:receptor expression-enhancing protein 4 [Mycena rebaudengoi]|nr:receptor expression-enhancing protein 4 [Mycena rebaudengoi]
MLFYLTSRIVSSVAAFLYPGYASYKTLSQRPASEEDLERWLMYWSVLGCIVGVEYVAEWVVCRRSSSFYLALPQTRGSTYLYTAHLAPLFRTHEAQIDLLLARTRVQVGALWEQLNGAVGAAGAPATGGNAQYNNDNNVPDARRQGDTGGVLGGLWRAYGPALLASGAAMLRPAAQRPLPGNHPSTSTHRRRQRHPCSTARRRRTLMVGRGRRRRQSILERRRQLEAELAALSSMSLPIPMPTPGSASSSSTSAFSRNSSGADLVGVNAGRQRTESFGVGGAYTSGGRFEEVEVPSDGEGYDVGYDMSSGDNSGRNGGRPGAGQARGSCGSGGKGYERVKSD